MWKDLFSNFLNPLPSVLSKSINYSALLFTPMMTLLAKSYADDIWSAVKVLAGVLKAWDPCLQVLEGHSDSITAVTFLSDGSHIVSTSLENTLQLWNVMTRAFIVSL